MAFFMAVNLVDLAGLFNSEPFISITRCFDEHLPAISGKTYFLPYFLLKQQGQQ